MDNPDPLDNLNLSSAPEVLIAKSSPLKKILKISLISLGIIILILTVILTLNYFNILSLSSLFPDKLDWMPRQSLSQIPTKGKALNPEEPILMPDSSPTQSASYQIKAREVLVKLLSVIFTPSFIPSPVSNLNLTQDKTNQQNFIVTFNTRQASMSGNLTLNKAGDNISTIYLSMPKTDQKNVSAAVAQTIAPQFFSITPQGKWACKKIGNETYCENFWEEKSGARRGIGIQEPITFDNKEKGIAVFFCEHNKGSSIYSWQSCTTEFAKTGVK
ncbi:hypothetical protein KKE78_02615 [Patescibacteria group bacterium]|nr:hypothetical protein [Patescibacteria group bacterium]